MRSTCLVATTDAKQGRSVLAQGVGESLAVGDERGNDAENRVG